MNIYNIHQPEYPDSDREPAELASLWICNRQGNSKRKEDYERVCHFPDVSDEALRSDP